MDNATGAMIGDIFGFVIGGIVWGYLFGLLVGRFFRRWDPDERAIAAIVGAWLLLAIVAGFGFANEEGTSFNFGAGIYYAPGAVIAFMMLRKRYWRLWEEPKNLDDLRDTFE